MVHLVETMLKNDTFIHLKSFVRTLCVTVILSLLMVVPAFADDDASSVSSGGDSVYNDYYTDVHVSPVIQTLPEGELLEVKSTVNTVSADDSTGFKSVILGLIGDYDTVVTDYTYQSGSGYTTHSIQIERDWSWIISACIFTVVLYCMFRIVGALFCRA